MGRSALRTCLFAGALLAAVDSAAQIPAPAPSQDRLSKALAGLKPQRPGVVDAYVIVAALDSTPVFGREAREAGRVLAKRFDADGRTLVLANDEGADKADAVASFDHLRVALQRDAALMNRDEDVIVLYTTSHGSPDEGLNLNDVADGKRVITPPELAQMLGEPGFKNRLIILQACFSGQFVPALQVARDGRRHGCFGVDVIFRVCVRKRLDILRLCPDQPGDAPARHIDPAIPPSFCQHPRLGGSRAIHAVQPADQRRQGNRRLAGSARYSRFGRRQRSGRPSARRYR